MEVLNATFPVSISRIPILSPKIRITSSRKNTILKITAPNLRISLFPPFSSPTSRNFRVSAHFGRPSNHHHRRNSLRIKLTELQQVRQNSDSQKPNPEVNDFDTFQSNSVNESENQSNLVHISDPANESKPKIIGDSVMWNKLEGWVDQYKKDSEFWGIGFGPIFTVFQDSDGKIKQVVVNEDEIWKRNGVEPSLYNQDDEKSVEVNSKISHANFLAREIESGDYELPKNSSLAKFIASGEQSGFTSAIRGFTLHSGLVRKLSRVGIVVLFGFMVVGALKTLATGDKDKDKAKNSTRLENEMLRRKLKARMAKETLVKGSVEVIQDEPELVSLKRPQLDKGELMENISKFKGSSEEMRPHNSSNSQAIGSSEFDKRILEIRSMARHARETEKREVSSGDSDEEDGETLSEMSNEEEAVKQLPEEGLSTLNGLTTEERESSSGDSDGEDNETLKEISNEKVAGKQLIEGGLSTPNGSIKPISIRNPNGDDNGCVSSIDLADSSDTQTSNISSVKVSDVRESTVQNTKGAESSCDSKPKIKVNESSVSPNSQSHISNSKCTKRKPRLIRSVQEAREFLNQNLQKQEPNQESQVRSLPSMKHTNSETTRGLDEDNKACFPSILGEALEFVPPTDACDDTTMNRTESVPETVIYPKIPEKESLVTDIQIPRTVGYEANGSSTRMGPKERDQELDQKNEVSQPSITGGKSDCTSDAIASEDSTLNTEPFVQTENRKPNDVKEEYEQVDHQIPESSLDLDSSNRSSKKPQSLNKGSWLERNYDQFEPIVEKIGMGFRENYRVTSEKVKQDLNLNPEMIQLRSDDYESELEWMKDDRLSEIVFKVRENELTGRDPFYLMDEDDKVAFFEGLEKKVEKENERLMNLHEYLHSNIENLDYGAEGISLHDSPEKIIPRWKGPPIDKNSTIFDDIKKQRMENVGGSFSNSYLREDRKISPRKSEESVSRNDDPATLAVNNQESGSKIDRTVIEGSDGSVRAGKKSGKEYWQHTKKWSRGFLESYNAENDPEIKAEMKDMGKDLDRWITEKEIQEAGDLMETLPERRRQFIEKKINKVKREMELFGPQAVVSKYREYGDEKKEDHLWWLDLPFVLCIELYTTEDGEQKTGFYSLEMAADLELQPKPYHVIAFEDPGDCKSFCYIVQAHMEMLGNGNAFVIARPPKDAYREAKENGFSVTVIRKGEMKLNIDQTLEEVEEQITEIGSKIYHDAIMKERSVDISSVMSGVLGTTAAKPKRRRRSKKKLKKPTKR